MNPSVSQQVRAGIHCSLQIWTRRVVRDYQNVRIDNMSTSFRNGLAFCAIIHHFRPHLLDYQSLQPSDVLDNNRLAFSLAETELGIASLLDPQVSIKTNKNPCISG